MGIGFFLMRIAVFVTVFYLIYFFYKSSRKPAGEKVAKAASTCPSPKVFVDYTEGRISGKKKKDIADHIACCKNCQDALKKVFDTTR